MHKKADKTTAENTTWAKSRKSNIGQKQQIHADWWHHVVWGGRRPPHIMWPASTFSIFLRMYFLLLPHIVFSVLACIDLYFWADRGQKSMFFQIPSNCSMGPIAP